MRIGVHIDEPLKKGNAMNSLQPVKLLPARERVASALRKAILTKELPPGTVITLEGIASLLEVSNTPVREAFQILIREGLIRQRPNKGAEVQEISRKFIHDHYETRAILERACAATVCRLAADTKDIESAYNSSKEALAAGDSSSYSNYNQAFHFAIWEAAGNDKVKALLAEMWNGLSMGHRVTEEEYAKISIAEHKGILEALLARDAKLAEQRMDAHIMRSLQNILTNFE